MYMVQVNKLTIALLVAILLCLITIVVTSFPFDIGGTDAPTTPAGVVEKDSAPEPQIIEPFTQNYIEDVELKDVSVLVDSSFKVDVAYEYNYSSSLPITKTLKVWVEAVSDNCTDSGSNFIRVDIKMSQEEVVEEGTE